MASSSSAAAAAPSHHLILLLVLLLLLPPLLATAQSNGNVTLGSSLAPMGRTTAWHSPSGDFAFGFRPLDSDPTLFLLAVWFENTADKTPVWYANGAAPVQSASKADLTTDGLLSLTDQNGNIIWNSSTGGAGAAVAYAAILDTGNFVLAGPDGAVLWQTFGSPTDTILPGQVLVLNTQLRSRLTDADYSDGRFLLSMQLDGNLVLYPVAIPAENIYKAYWASGTFHTGSRLVFNESGSIYVALQNDTVVNVLSDGGVPMSGSYHRATIDPDGVPMSGSYHRATIDPDGVFRRYVYAKNGTSWEGVDAVPENICTLTADVGNVACGFNSYCKSGSANQRVDCECPPHYTFLDPSRKYKGCKPEFGAQSCDSNGSDVYFTDMTNVDWPFDDYEQFSFKDENQCKKECSTDCFCAVAIYDGSSCWKKKLPLSNGRMGDDVSRKAFIKVSSNNSFPQQSLFVNERKHQSAWKLVGSVLLGSSVFLNILLITAICVMLFCSCCSITKSKRPQPAPSISRLSLRAFTYKELAETTNNFSEEVGRGAFGTVYKGFLGSDRRDCVAVKKLNHQLQESDKEFMNEVQAIAQTHHKNLVKLLGFCEEGTERLLVYEFMSNGSLTSYLFGCTRPDWNQRVRIAAGICRGLVYLHEECSTQIIHCDIKPENVLLDDSFVAKISDFGLAKLMRADQTRTNTGIRGTKGYVAPEWFKNVAVGAKVDVYSFGVMLLEIICCRKNVEKEVQSEEEIILTYWAYDCYRDGKLELLVGCDGEALTDLRRVERIVMVAIWCIQEDPWMRPSMQKVMQMLDGTVVIPPPPDPSGNTFTTPSTGLN